jgi:uracil-DNA glycosylase
MSYPETEFLSIIEFYRRHLYYLMEEGIEGIPAVLHKDPVDSRLIEDFGREFRKEPATGTVLSDPETELNRLRLEIGDCTRCKLHRSRSNLVFGEGNFKPDLVLVGEGPGFDEDRVGRPFVGAAGKLLDRIIRAMGLTRDQVYICNVVKCHPPQNRDPEPEEIKTCGSFLTQQLEILNPALILALGRISGRFLTHSPPGTPLHAMRNRLFSFNGIDVAVTYHPSAILRNPAYRRPVWEDVQVVMKRLERPISGFGA